jgi:hypothetical protein
MILTILSASGLQGWRTLINNFAVETVQMNGQQMGVVQSIREIPGFLSLLVIYLLLIIQEHRLAALSILVLGLGVALTGMLPTFYGVLFTTLIMSTGFHYYETLNQSLTLQYFETNKAPVVFGRLRGIASGANIVIGIVIFFASMKLSYGQMFILLGLFIMATGMYFLFQDPTDKNIVPQHKKMIFRLRYWLFYALTFMSGARRQIFVAFAVFLLVERFHYSLQAVTTLFVVNNMINYFLSPAIGKAIARFGERKILSLEYFSLIWIFLAYAFTDSKILVGIMYILDHIFFNFAVAIRTYFQKIADPRDIAPSMAMGFTINHIAAVVVPVFGGFLWMVDYKIPFLIGVGMSVVSLCLTQFINTSSEIGHGL